MMKAFSSPKSSKIPILKKAKTLNPLKHNTLNDNEEIDKFKYCRNCCQLRDNCSVMEQNMATLLKENNYLRQQLALSNQSYGDSPTQIPVIDQVVCEDGISLQAHKISAQTIDTATELVEGINTQPFLLMPGHPFNNFDVNILDREIDYSHELSNRKVKFYGDVPYIYSDIVHDPCQIPEDSYILKIIEQVKTLFPQYRFNSCLVNRYDNGNSHIPLHSDDEYSIKPDSCILTISLGETRSINFQPKNNLLGSEISINLQHGDVYTMSTASQGLFRHCVPKDNSKFMRISLTFRDLICPNNPTLNSSLDSVGNFLFDLSIITPGTPTKMTSFNELPESSQLPTAPTDSPNIICQPIATDIPSQTTENIVDTIFISSSMFSDLDEVKLSSNHHKAAVFFFRGATAGGILHKLKNDSNFRKINPGSIKQVFLLSGTNDVDNILNVQKSDHYNVNVDSNRYDQYIFDRTLNDIENLVSYIHNWSLNARINILNILPRASIHRNHVINNLNNFLKNICYHEGYLNYINTEFNVCLFSRKDGFRKDMFFKVIGSDNVHLNKSGILRLGKHLKYILHLDCPRRLS